ncbi:MAG TPA: NAD(P)-binding domain-containing protein [Gemmatimonadales bacterium]
MTEIALLDVIVIGGAQAGLSAGCELSRHGLRFVILDAEARTGDGWRRRWDSLRLFTPARYSGLPGLPFPGPPYHLPSKDEVADYLEQYARHFRLPVRLDSRVRAVRRAPWGFEVETGDEVLRAANVIVATGPFQRSRIPAFAAELDPGIVQLHSSEYRNPPQLPPGHALVVGAGNSGAQVAIELAATRRVRLAGRDTGRIPRRLLGRDIYDWIWPILGLSVDSRLGRRMAARMARHGDPLVGITQDDLAAAGVERTGRVVGVRDGLPLLDGGVAADVRSVIWSTGFKPDLSWLDLPALDERGRPMHRRGISPVPGLYFLGQRLQARLGSSLIGGVGRDAREVVAHIANRHPSGV